MNRRTFLGSLLALMGLGPRLLKSKPDVEGITLDIREKNPKPMGASWIFPMPDKFEGDGTKAVFVRIEPIEPDDPAWSGVWMSAGVADRDGGNDGL